MGLAMRLMKNDQESKAAKVATTSKAKPKMRRQKQHCDKENIPPSNTNTNTTNPQNGTADGTGKAQGTADSVKLTTAVICFSGFSEKRRVQLTASIKSLNVVLLSKSLVRLP